MNTQIKIKNENLIAQYLLTPEGKEKLCKAMHFDTVENFSSAYGHIFERAEKKYTSENYIRFLKNFELLCR